MANGITKAVTASLETQDVLGAKHRTYRKMLQEVRGLLELFERALSTVDSSPEELDCEDDLKSATTDFVSKNVLASVILADVEISRCILLPHCVPTAAMCIPTTAMCIPTRHGVYKTTEDCTHYQQLSIHIGTVVYTHL